MEFVSRDCLLVFLDWKGEMWTDKSPSKIVALFSKGLIIATTLKAASSKGDFLNKFASRDCLQVFLDWKGEIWTDKSPSKIVTLFAKGLIIATALKAVSSRICEVC